MANITKHDLVTDIAVTTGIAQKDAKKVVECFLDLVSHHLVKGNSIEIRGVGTFSVKSRKGRPVRNPRTGEQFHLGSRAVPAIKFSDDIKDAVLNSYPRSFE